MTVNCSSHDVDCSSHYSQLQQPCQSTAAAMTVNCSSHDVDCSSHDVDCSSHDVDCTSHDSRLQQSWCRLQQSWCLLQQPWCRLQQSWCRLQQSWCRLQQSWQSTAAVMMSTAAAMTVDQQPWQSTAAVMMSSAAAITVNCSSHDCQLQQSWQSTAAVMTVNCSSHDVDCSSHDSRSYKVAGHRVVKRPKSEYPRNVTEHTLKLQVYVLRRQSVAGGNFLTSIHGCRGTTLRVVVDYHHYRSSDRKWLIKRTGNVKTLGWSANGRRCPSFKKGCLRCVFYNQVFKLLLWLDKKNMYWFLRRCNWVRMCVRVCMCRCMKQNVTANITNELTSAHFSKHTHVDKVSAPANFHFKIA